MCFLRYDWYVSASRIIRPSIHTTDAVLLECVYVCKRCGEKLRTNYCVWIRILQHTTHHSQIGVFVCVCAFLSSHQYIAAKQLIRLSRKLCVCVHIIWICECVENYMENWKREWFNGHVYVHLYTYVHAYAHRTYFHVQTADSVVQDHHPAKIKRDICGLSATIPYVHI